MNEKILEEICKCASKSVIFAQISPIPTCKPMQLSLVDEIPELNKVFFLDIFVETYFDSRRNRMRLETIQGQPVPPELKVSCPAKIIQHFPEGTILKLDARLVRHYGRSPFFISINRRNIQRALEFFDYNLKVANGFDYELPKRYKSKKN